MTRGTKNRPKPSPKADRAAAERGAYAALEECRLRCERLLADGVGRPGLRRVHRGLGLAGYYVSSHLKTDSRHEALARAREACAAEVTDPAAAMVALDQAVDRATVAVESALDTTALADYAHLAQVHLMEADQAFQNLAVDATPGS